MGVDLLVFVEGKKTEEQYLVAWHRLHRTSVNVEFGDTRGAPLTLVKAAVAAKKREHREEQKGRGRAHDQIWCVFDKDAHPKIPEAFDLARAHDIKIAFSNPCMELWFLLHFRDQNTELHRHDAQRAARAYLNCEKNLTPQATSLMIESYTDAKVRAIRLDSKHADDGSPPMANPSSGMWRLVDVIKNASNGSALRN